MKKINILLLFITCNLFGQNLKVNNNGNVKLDGKSISANEVRTLLSKQTEILELYNSGRTKKTVGNVLLLGGISLISIDLLTALNADVTYPSALTFVGSAALIVSIPVKIGFLKKIKTSINNYNNFEKKSAFRIEKINFIGNKNGLGFALIF